MSLKIFKYQFSRDETSLGLEIFFSLDWFWAARLVPRRNKIIKPYFMGYMHDGQNWKANQKLKDNFIKDCDRIITASSLCWAERYMTGKNYDVQNYLLSSSNILLLQQQQQQWER